MASLIILKRRIRIAGNIAKTTRAMQMVAASKTRRAQESALAGRPYNERLLVIARNLIGRMPPSFTHPFYDKRENGKTLLVILSPDKGLCGGLISNLTRELFNFPNLKDVFFVTVGKKLSRTVVGGKLGIILADFPMGTSRPTFEQIPPLVKIISEGFLNKEWNHVFVLYPQFQSLFLQKPHLAKILPIERETEREAEITAPTDYLFEPNVLDVLESLLPHYLESQLYQLLLDAFASEQAARMMAMQNATENAKEIIEDLTMEYNKIRQEKITSEILDGARAAHSLSV